MSHELAAVIAFLRDIGLRVDMEEDAKGFVDGVRIVEGALMVDPGCRPSTLLHEAGHTACVPARFRGYMNDNLGAGMKRMFEDLRKMKLDPDHPLNRAAIQCSDPEATAWAWAAGLAVGLPPRKIVMDDEYDGDGAGIRSMLQARQYFGINGLAHAGMCRQGWMVPDADRYPKMLTWLQAA